MISRLRGKLIKKEKNKVILEVGGIFYEINLPDFVFSKIKGGENSTQEFVIYHYLKLGKNHATPVLIGFLEEMEKEFFEKFITVAGIGPRAALRAFHKPISHIASVIENGDIDSLCSLDGIGKQKAKHIIATLQGKVGRFTLLPSQQEQPSLPSKQEIVDDVRKILKRLQYNSKDIEAMIKNAFLRNSKISSVEELLNEIYRQRKSSLNS